LGINVITAEFQSFEFIRLRYDAPKFAKQSNSFYLLDSQWFDLVEAQYYFPCRRLLFFVEEIFLDIC
jgi:hypothetical protein